MVNKIYSGPADDLIQSKPHVQLMGNKKREGNTCKETFKTPAFRRWIPPPPAILCLALDFGFGSGTHSGAEREGGAPFLPKSFPGGLNQRCLKMNVICCFVICFLSFCPSPNYLFFPLNHYTIKSNAIYGFSLLVELKIPFR